MMKFVSQVVLPYPELAISNARMGGYSSSFAIDIYILKKICPLINVE